MQDTSNADDSSTASSRPSPGTIVLDTGLITLCWAGLLILFALLSARGYPVGFDVWPLGEDRNWIDLFQRGGALGVPSLFWPIDARNPLSPWWYVAASPVILSFANGLLLLRYAVGLALALAAYGFVLTVTAGRQRVYALAVGMVSALAMANAYFDQIFWNFQGALVVSLLSVSLYARFLGGGRRQPLVYAASLCLYLLAIGTYTLQSGAVLAVGWLALTWPSREPVSLAARMRRAIADALPFAVVFVLFVLIWRTATPVSAAPPTAPTLAAFVRSLQEGLWHGDIGLLWAVLSLSDHRTPYRIIGAVAGVAVATAFLLANLRTPVLTNRATDRRTSADLAWVASIVLCLAVPTIVLETTAANWGPGSRWRMIYQLTTPVFLVALLFIGAGFTRSPRAVRGAGVAVLAGLVVTLALAHNERQVVVTRSERAVQQAMEAAMVENLAAGRTAPHHFLLRLDLDPGFRWMATEDVNPVMARTWFRAWGEVGFRIMVTSEFASLLTRAPVRLTDTGVERATLDGRTVPDDHVTVLAAGRTGVRRLSTVTARDVAGYTVEWARTGPFVDPVIQPGCPLDWSAGETGLVSGWSAPSAGPEPTRTLEAPVGRIVLPPRCHAARTASVRLAAAPDVLKRLTIRINDRPVPATVRADGTGLDVALPVSPGGQVLALDVVAPASAGPVTLKGVRLAP